MFSPNTNMFYVPGPKNLHPWHGRQNGWGGSMGVGTPAAPWLVVRATRKRDGGWLAPATPLKREDKMLKQNVAVKHLHSEYKYGYQDLIENEWHFAKLTLRQHRQPGIVGCYLHSFPYKHTLNPPGIHCGNLPTPPLPTSEGHWPESWNWGQANHKSQRSCNYLQAWKIWNDLFYNKTDNKNNLHQMYSQGCQLVVHRLLSENKDMNREPINNPHYISQFDGTKRQIKFIQHLFNIQRWKRQHYQILQKLFGHEIILKLKRVHTQMQKYTSKRTCGRAVGPLGTADTDVPVLITCKNHTKSLCNANTHNIVDNTNRNKSRGFRSSKSLARRKFVFAENRKKNEDFLDLSASKKRKRTTRKLLRAGSYWNKVLCPKKPIPTL